MTMSRAAPIGMKSGFPGETAPPDADSEFNYQELVFPGKGPADLRVSFFSILGRAYGWIGVTIR